MITRPVISTPVVPYVESPGTATVLTLGAKMCKWPIGDPSSDSFSFCGRRADDGTPTASSMPGSPTSRRKRPRSATPAPTCRAACAAICKRLRLAAFRQSYNSTPSVMLTGFPYARAANPSHEALQTPSSLRSGEGDPEVVEGHLA
ncbi:GcrA family cell cycle regulator [Asticcacaulis biprosthecium]|uniref:GcrA family cell cycle regulator n=1 Tax=Asticcacaulis biprosthecium TaxID=76891 RepID=UPI0035AC12D9